MLMIGYHVRENVEAIVKSIWVLVMWAPVPNAAFHFNSIAFLLSTLFLYDCFGMTEIIFSSFKPLETDGFFAVGRRRLGIKSCP